MFLTKKLSLLATLLFATSFLQADELLRNGDLSRGNSPWKGDRKIVEEDGNKYIHIDLDRRKDRVFSQEKLNTKGVRNILLTFRYRTSEDYEGDGITLRFARPTGGSTFRTVRLQPTPEWKTYTWDFSNNRQTDELTLQIEIRSGKGSIMFDDFSAMTQ